MDQDNRFIEGHSFPLNGMECKYIYVFQPDTKFGDPAWKIDIELPEATATQMKAKGFNVKLRKDKEKKEIPGSWYITAKRKCFTAAGKELTPPNVVDQGSEDQDPQDWPKSKIIGNGSILNLQLYAKYYEVNGTMNLPLYLNGVQVVKHVPYGDSGFKSVGGNTGDVPF